MARLQASASTRADEVRIVGHETDLTLSVAGPRGRDRRRAPEPARAASSSTQPVEDATEGMITYSEFPAVEEPHVVENARLVFSRRARRRRVGGARARRRSSRRSTATRARACSASSGSAATRGSSGTCGTRSSTRRSTARSTSRSARASRRRRREQSAVHWDMVKDLRARGPDRVRRPGRAARRNLDDLKSGSRFALAMTTSDGEERSAERFPSFAPCPGASSGTLSEEPRSSERACRVQRSPRSDPGFGG